MATQGVRSYTVVSDVPVSEMKLHYDGDSATMYAAPEGTRSHEGMQTFVEATPTQLYEHQSERSNGEPESREAANHFVNMHGDSAYEQEQEHEHEQSSYMEGEREHSMAESEHHGSPNNFVNLHGDTAYANDAAHVQPNQTANGSQMAAVTPAAAGNEPQAVNELDPLSYGSEIYTHRKDLPLVAPADKPVSAHPVVMTMPQSPFAPTMVEGMHPVIRFVMNTISAATNSPSPQGPSFPPGPWPQNPAPAGPASQGPPPPAANPMPQGPPPPPGPMPQGPPPPTPNASPSQSVVMVTKFVTPAVKFVTETAE
ncbi:hypothetical protein FBU59_003504 [Linderina macrospora]|uniref:Uncharacterized protein n=1 Tax=Linderina macrospora TaxID=4868 RepID=A0ACC1J868_9FUNG|nr:hypothetical protein FBU59_003504 [Linderina macrospora]